MVSRQTGHLRHWHKYGAGQIPAEHRFYWRSGPEETLGVASANVTEFHQQLSRANPIAIRHHAVGHDFSRWFRNVLRDTPLADTTLGLERHLNAALNPTAVEEARSALLAAIEDRYLT